ncbi:MAG: dihydrofolate reductase [Lachnospiraceae bacterium]|nr:dihydrofolate reductase [Lachnospiraceae bacterium]
MKRFHKMTVVGPTRFTEASREKMGTIYAEEAIFIPYVPRTEEELIEVIADSDCLLVALQVKVTKKVIDACPSLRYIGMCCSLYNPESANVDFPAANEKGIVVTGIRDYGDEGVVEFVISELVQLLHGFGAHQWREVPTELTGQKIGILGMGTVGHRITAALNFFGADVYYYSRTKKDDVKATYLPLNELMETVDIAIGCLNKNAVIVGEEAMAHFGNDKILMNIAIGPFVENEVLGRWLAYSGNWYICDELWGLGDESFNLRPNVICPAKSAGNSTQLVGRYNKKILENIEAFLNEA